MNPLKKVNESLPSIGPTQSDLQTDHTEMTLHFGLDSACSAKVTVHWPSGPRKVEHFEVDGNARYVVMQGGEAEREESTD